MMSEPDLSPHERAILKLLAEGNRTSEIAKRLSLSYKEVADAIRAIKTRAGEPDLSELLHRYRFITGNDK